jgi:hypothetical protein
MIKIAVIIMKAKPFIALVTAGSNRTEHNPVDHPKLTPRTMLQFDGYYVNN